MLSRRFPRGSLVATIAAAGLIVKQLNIPVLSSDDAVQVGRGICSALDAGRIEPAPTIRSVISSLRSKGLDKGQSVGLLRGAVSVYCPQYTALVSR